MTGRPAEDFETIARRYAALPQNQRTFANRLREFAQFMMGPLRPGYNFDRYDRELRRPFPSEPQFAPESEVWRREHGIGSIAEQGKARRHKTHSAASRTQPAIVPGEPVLRNNVIERLTLPLPIDTRDASRRGSLW